jgi:protein-disulfide isomerase
MRYMWWVSAGLALALSWPSGAWAAGSGVPTVAPDDITLGKADAPVTIFEFASLTCPHCAEFNVDTLPKIKTDWIEPGKAKLIYRDYPLDQAALRAAMLAHCAPPERFYGFIDVLFHSQQSWAVNGDVAQGLVKIALLGGVSQDQFSKCMADQKLADRIVAQLLVGQDQYGVDSTPTFFINGKKVVGSLPYEQFVSVLDAAFTEAGGKTTMTAPAPAAAPVTAPATAAAPAAMPTPSGPASQAGPVPTPDPPGFMDRVKSAVGRLWASTLAYFR